MSTTNKDRDEDSQAIIRFLQSNVPRSEVPNIESELKKDFLLAKKRSKDRKKNSKKRRSRVLTRNEKKALGFFSISKTSVRYSDMIPLNQVWNEYISHTLELDKVPLDNNSNYWEQFTQSFYKADFHGSSIHVIRSKCPSYVGKNGICVMDTKNTFKLVSQNNIITTIPKRECVFEINLKDRNLLLYGKHLCTRPAERSVKKIKTYIHPDL